MNVKIRLEQLEAKKRINPGVIVLGLAADGSASYTTPQGERKTFVTEEAALDYINGKFDDAAVIIIDL